MSTETPNNTSGPDDSGPGGQDGDLAASPNHGQNQGTKQPTETTNEGRNITGGSLWTALITAGATVIVVGLLVNIFERRHEGLQHTDRIAEVDEDTDDPAVWGQNWPRQYETYARTVDHERTRYGGSDAVPVQKLDKDPWLRVMWSGYAFSLDYREARGHAFMLQDQENTERIRQREQPGACLHCHASVMPAYRAVGDGDVMEGFRLINDMDYHEARELTGDDGEALIEHPVSCVDCHNPETMQLRVSRPAFLEGIAAYKDEVEDVEEYNPNVDASRQEMRTYVCAQCHVEYYFSPDETRLTYPWTEGLTVDDQEAYYDDIEFSDWTHGYTGGEMLKAQHPEFEMYSQGPHAQAGVACADCHMPYQRDGAMKFSNHHVRSPLLDVSSSCMTCHGGEASDMLSRVHTIQDRTQALIDRSSTALVDLMDAIVAAREAGASDEELEAALDFQRKAQWRLDWVYSENSRGFHAPQESARILGDSIDYARQGYAALPARRAAEDESGDDSENGEGERGEEPSRNAPPPQGVTPEDAAPPGNY